MEIEVKVLEVNRAEVEKKILALGGKKVFDGDLCALMYDKDKALYEDCAILRLRKEGEKNVITYKKSIHNNGAKHCEEYESELSDFEDMKKVIEALGFECFLEQRKRRITYVLNGTKIEFDKYLDEFEYIPEFAEIEGESVENIDEIIEKLGVDKEKVTSKNFFDLKEMYK